MADIEYRCVNCGVSRIVSEFADAAKLKCAACGGGLRKASAMTQDSDPDREIAVDIPKPGSGRLKLAARKPDTPDPILSLSNAAAHRKDELELHPKVKRKHKGANHMLLAFALFAALAILTGYWRYAAEWSLPGHERLPVEWVGGTMRFAWAVLLALNLLVVVRAMNDNILQGILCLLVPGWSLVYLLFISDNFYLRAVVFGFLAGTLQDGGMQIGRGVGAAASRVDQFISSGGGAIRRAEPRPRR